MFWKQLVFSLLIIGLVPALATTAFAEDGSSESEEAQQPQTPEGMTSYALDPVHSSLVFRIKHLDVGYVFGMFREVDGAFEFDPDNPSAGSFEFTAATGSVFTNQQNRDDHLRSPDFFAAEEHPELTFKSTSIEETNSGTYRIVGDLTLRGVSEEIEILADQTGTGHGMEGEFRRGFMTTFAVNRMSHGVDFMPDGLGEYVRVTFSIQGIAQ